jgi:hypothetical protein
VIFDASGARLECSVELESEPVLRPLLFVTTEGTSRDVPLYARRELGLMAASRIHALLRPTPSQSTETSRDVAQQSAVGAPGYAVLVKESSGLISITGRDPAGKAWSTWTFLREDMSMPVLAPGMTGTINVTIEGNLSGGIRWDSSSGVQSNLDVEGSAYHPPATGSTFFGNDSANVQLTSPTDAGVAYTGSCDARGTIRLNDQFGTRGHLHASPRSGVLFGSLRMRQPGFATRGTGLFIPHLNAFEGVCDGEAFELRPQ